MTHAAQITVTPAVHFSSAPSSSPCHSLTLVSLAPFPLPSPLLPFVLLFQVIDISEADNLVIPADFSKEDRVSGMWWRQLCAGGAAGAGDSSIGRGLCLGRVVAVVRVVCVCTSGW